MVAQCKTQCPIIVTYMKTFLVIMSRDILEYAEHMCAVVQGWLSVRVNHDMKTLVRMLSLSWKKNYLKKFLLLKKLKIETKK